MVFVFLLSEINFVQCLCNDDNVSLTEIVIIVIIIYVIINSMVFILLGVK